MKNNYRLAFSVGIVAFILIFVDYLIAPLFKDGLSFTWMAFISWTVFFGSSIKEKAKGIVGVLLGFFLANIISNLSFNILISALVVGIINMLIMLFADFKKTIFSSVSGIFVGLALTFSGAGISLNISSFKLFLIILIYIVIGMLCDIVVKKLQGKK
jgi:hypothetical protein